MTAQLKGQIVTASFEDGVSRGPECGDDDCECTEHTYSPRPAGTYLTIRLDEDTSIGLWRVAVVLDPLDGAKL